MKTYRIRREWTVIMESWCEVEAGNKVEACTIAIEECDFDEQSVAADSDGPTFISRIECDGEELVIPKAFTEEEVCKCEKC